MSMGALNTAKSLLEIHEAVSHSIDDAEFEEVLLAVADSIDDK